MRPEGTALHGEQTQNPPFAKGVQGGALGKERRWKLVGAGVDCGRDSIIPE
jgi:hypothetical protein